MALSALRVAPQAGSLDSWLMKSAQSGDSESYPDFAAQALPFADQLYAGAMRLAKNPSDAADLVQETYLIAFQAFHQFE